MDGIEVSVFVDSVAAHLHQIYTGLHHLHCSGKIRLRLSSRRAHDAVPGPYTNVWLVARSGKDNQTRRICFDMADGNRVLATEQLKACDVYFKRSFYQPTYRSFPEELKSKILPLGLNFVCASKNGFAYRTKLALRSFTNTKERGRGPLVDSLKAILSTFQFIDKQAILLDSDFEIPPSREASLRIFFQPRIFDLEHSSSHAELHQLNETRANTVRALRTHFGDAFVGGVARSSYSARHYPDCLSSHSVYQADYLKPARECLVCVSTLGVSKSTPWKIAEYMAGSRCIVSEPLTYALPVALENGANVLTFTNVEECVQACERILGDSNLATQMRRANWQYYQEYVKPDALVWRCLNIVPPMQIAKHSAA
jgi:hypothetical protein